MKYALLLAAVLCSTACNPVGAGGGGMIPVEPVPRGGLVPVPLALAPEEVRLIAERGRMAPAQVQMLAMEGKLEKDHCCVHAFEEKPDPAGATRENCGGTRWSTGIAGHCHEQKNSFCAPGHGQTRVTVHEYDLVWDEKLGICTAKATGAKDSVQVEECGGFECKDGD